MLTYVDSKIAARGKLKCADSERIVQKWFSAGCEALVSGDPDRGVGYAAGLGDNALLYFRFGVAAISHKSDVSCIAAMNYLGDLSVENSDAEKYAVGLACHFATLSRAHAQYAGAHLTAMCVPRTVAAVLREAEEFFASDGHRLYTMQVVRDVAPTLGLS